MLQQLQTEECKGECDFFMLLSSSLNIATRPMNNDAVHDNSWLESSSLRMVQVPELARL